MNCECGFIYDGVTAFNVKFCPYCGTKRTDEKPRFEIGEKKCEFAFTIDKVVEARELIEALKGFMKMVEKEIK